MAAPVIYRSSDSSAPVLTGTAGDLVALLDACLVNGYGAKSAAGWSKPFTGTNAAVLRMGAGNQFYLDCNDNGASSGLTGASGKEAAVRGYEVMTAVSTGTGPFPTTAQVAAATSNWRKSATADATARGWFMVADNRSFVLGILDGDVLGRYKIYYFGDIYSLKTSDAYRVGITVRTVVNTTASTGAIGTVSAQLGVAAGGTFLARIAAGTGTSHSAGVTIAGSTWDAVMAFPAPDGNLYLSRMLLGETNGVLRGWLRGVYEIVTAVGLADGDTFTGAGDFAGRSFVVARGLGGADVFSLALETTALDTSS